MSGCVCLLLDRSAAQIRPQQTAHEPGEALLRGPHFVGATAYGHSVTKRWGRRLLSPPAPPVPRADPVEVQAFIDQARWLHGYHESRSSTLGTRGGVLLGFVGVMVALMPTGFTFAKGRIKFTGWIEFNVVVALVLLVVAGACCLGTIATRKATVQNADQLSRQWHRYATGGPRGLVLAQIAHSYLGGSTDLDPIAAAADEADSRATWFKWSLRAAGAAVIALVALTSQILKQQL
jgi:hypothetical protein